MRCLPWLLVAATCATCIALQPSAQPRSPAAAARYGRTSSALAARQKKKRGSGFSEKLQRELSGAPEDDGRAWTSLSGLSLPDIQTRVRGWALPLGDEELSLAVVLDTAGYWALETSCTRCGFDLHKGELLSGGAESRIACPTCGTTFGVQTGTPGEPVERGGVGGIVGKLALQATAGNPAAPAQTFPMKVENAVPFMDISAFVPTSEKKA